MKFDLADVIKEYIKDRDYNVKDAEYLIIGKRGALRREVINKMLEVLTLKVDANNVGNILWVAIVVSNIIAVKGNELGGLIGKALSKLSNFDIKNIAAVKPIKNNVIKPLLKVAACTY